MTIKIDFSNVDFSFHPSSYEPLPAGEYDVAITSFKMREVKSGNNAGKPYAALELTVQEGEYINRKLWTNVMFFNMESGNWMLGQFLRGFGNEHMIETGNVSTEYDDYVGKEGVAIVGKVRNTYQEKKLGDEWDGEPIYKNEVKGYLTEDTEDTRKGPGVFSPI